MLSSICGNYSSVFWGARKQVPRVKQEFKGVVENEVTKSKSDDG